MKAHRIVFPLQKPLRCDENLSPSLFSQLWLWALGLCTPVKMKCLTILRKIAHARKEVHAGLVALLLASTAKINRRIFVGLGLMGVVAPVSACFYLLFDRVAYVEGWYHVNYFHLFFLLGPHLFLVFCLAGAFLLFPEGNKRGYMLIIPMGVTIAKMIWLVMTDSNADFWSIVPSSILLIGLLISAFLFIALDWLVHRKFHRDDAFDARLAKLIELADDFDDAKFKSMVKTVWREKKVFEKQF